MKDEAMRLQSQLEQEARNMGAAYFGAADLSIANNGSITPYEKQLISEYPSAISVGVPLLDSVVDRLSNQNDVYSLKYYFFHYVDIVNPLINRITLRLSCMLANLHYAALPIPATLTVDEGKLYGMFSNKLAASLSGLGWIGKSCLLITPDRGPRVRWGTVLTNAPLNTGKPVKEKCGNCIKCVEACPAGAFTGRNFNPEESREIRMLARKCKDYEDARSKDLDSSVCGLCIYICPLGLSKEKIEI